MHVTDICMGKCVCVWHMYGQVCVCAGNFYFWLFSFWYFMIFFISWFFFFNVRVIVCVCTCLCVCVCVCVCVGDCVCLGDCDTHTHTVIHTCLRWYAHVSHTHSTAYMYLHLSHVYLICISCVSRMYWGMSPIRPNLSLICPQYVLIYIYLMCISYVSHTYTWGTDLLKFGVRNVTCVSFALQ